MKKFVYIFLCVLLVVSMVAPAWAAAQIEEAVTVPLPAAKQDSSDIDQAVLDALYLPGGAKVVYVYGRWIADAFASKSYRGIESVLDPAYSMGKDNVVVSSGESSMTTYVVEPIDEETGTLAYTNETRDIIYDPKVIREYLDPSVIYMVEDDIQIHAAFVVGDCSGSYMNGHIPVGDTGSMVFYKTDKGNYIYLVIGNTEYLMPESGIIPFAKSYFDWKSEVYASGLSNPGINDGTRELLAQYDINAKGFSLESKTLLENPVLWSCVAMIPIAAVGIGLYVKKRKAQRTAQMQEDTSA